MDIHFLHSPHTTTYQVTIPLLLPEISSWPRLAWCLVPHTKGFTPHWCFSWPKVFIQVSRYRLIRLRLIIKVMSDWMPLWTCIFQKSCETSCDMPLSHQPPRHAWFIMARQVKGSPSRIGLHQLVQYHADGCKNDDFGLVCLKNLAITRGLCTSYHHQTRHWLCSCRNFPNSGATSVGDQPVGPEIVLKSVFITLQE